jgi:hypothetical protein
VAWYSAYNKNWSGSYLSILERLSDGHPSQSVTGTTTDKLQKNVMVNVNVEINQLHALNYILLNFLLRWLLHVSAKQCHPQGATMFLSEPLQHQYGRR